MSTVGIVLAEGVARLLAGGLLSVLLHLPAHLQYRGAPGAAARTSSRDIYVNVTAHRTR